MLTPVDLIQGEDEEDTQLLAEMAVTSADLANVSDGGQTNPI